MQAYQVMGTPAGYLVNEDGRIASTMALGADAVLELLDAKPLEPSDDPGEHDHDHGGNGHMPGMEMAVGGDAAGTALKTPHPAQSNNRPHRPPAATERPNLPPPPLPP